MKIRLKRVYEQPSAEDGVRVLVDRLWPRGLSKEHAAVNEWLREAAPSTELRRWFAHDHTKWTEFKKRYTAELASPEAKAVLSHIRSLAAKGVITLVYAASDEEYNNAVALKEYLLKQKA